MSLVHYEKLNGEVDDSAHLQVQEVLFPNDYLLSGENEKILVEKTEYEISEDSLCTDFCLLTRNVLEYQFFMNDKVCKSVDWLAAVSFPCFEQINPLLITGANQEASVTEEENEERKMEIKLLKDSPFFSEICTQTSIARVPTIKDGKRCYRRGINYLSLRSASGKAWKLGTLCETNAQHGLILRYNEIQRERGRLVLTGVGTDKHNIVFFQIAKVHESICALEMISQMFQETPTPGVMVCEPDTERSRNFTNMEKNQGIGVESCEVFRIFQQMVERAAKWDPRKRTFITSGMRRDFIKIVEDSLDDPRVLHSVLRVSHILANQNSKIFQNLREPGRFNSIAKIWDSLTKIIVLAKKITHFQPKPNILECAMLTKHKPWFALMAFLIASCQISLGVCLCWYVCKDERNFRNSKINPFVAILMSAVSALLVFYQIWTEIVDVCNFWSIFPRVPWGHNWALGIMDILVNLVLAVLILILSFFLIGTSNSLLDVVLNSVAPVFIIELDDTLNPLDEKQTQNLFKEYLTQNLLDSLDKIYPKIVREHFK